MSTQKPKLRKVKGRSFTKKVIEVKVVNQIPPIEWGIFNNIIMDRYKKLLWLIFKEKTEGCDIYHNHGSIWLILTDEKKWVIELTKEGTLWYNYYFFKDCFRLLSLDVTENQNYITEWVEDNIISKVKRTVPESIADSFGIEDTIQNGVKHTEYGDWLDGDERLDDIIQNGVKETKHNPIEDSLAMEEVIQNGVKKTFGQKMKPILLGDIIKNGINETHDDSYHHKGRVEGIINNRVQETNPPFLEILNSINFEPVIKEMKRMNEVNIVLEKGIEETHWRRVDNHPTYLDRIIKN